MSDITAVTQKPAGFTIPDDNMVDRVARVMVDENHRLNPAVDAWAYQDKYGRFNARAIARAAIEAMREPTKAMADAPYGAEIPKTDPPMWPLAYQAMIDAALKD